MANPNNVRRANPNKKSKAGKIGLIAGLSVLALFLIVIAAGWFLFQHYYGLLDRGGDFIQEIFGLDAFGGDDDEGSDIDADPTTAEEADAIKSQIEANAQQMEKDSDLYATDAFNLLLIGVDSRGKNFSGRSDAMILLSINKKTKQITMTSILRDIYVTIPGHPNNRLNAAYAFGGTELLKDTIRSNLGITIDRYVCVNFYLVADLVDEVGGISIKLTAAEIADMNRQINEQNKVFGNPEGTDRLSDSDAGTNVYLNGNQALAYARCRHSGNNGDFGRTNRQQIVINKCLEKIKKMKVSKINDLANEFLPRVRTDLTQADCANLLLILLDVSNYEMQSMTIPQEGTYKGVKIDGKSVFSIDFKKNVEAWHKMVEGE